jgi:hypothetical protein
VVQYHLHDYPHLPLMSTGQERLEVLQRPVARVHRRVVRDVVPIVSQRRRTERQKPDRVDSQLLQIIQFLCEPGKVTYAVAVAVVKSAYVQLIDDGVSVPELVIPQRQ